MAKALRPLIIILFLLSIGALVLGTMLFQQREILKGRTQKLEKAVANIATKIRYDEFKITSIQDYATMDGPLNKVAVMGDNLYEELQLTKQDLENTREKLAMTEQELENTRQELAQTKETLENTREELDQRTAELAQANGRIDELDQEVSGLTTEIEDLNTQLAETEENLAEAEANFDSLKRDFDKLVGEISGPKTARGLMGQILLVNQDWNFVVLNLGSEAGLIPQAEMLIQREDVLVGRIKVSTVEDYIAVAEILTDWEQLAPRKGDHVISPET